MDNDTLLIRIISCPRHDPPKLASLRWGTWDKSPISTATNHHLQHGLKQQTLSIMDIQQDLTSGIKRFRHQGYAGFKGGFPGFSKQLLLTKHLSPYCQVINSRLIRLTFLLGFAALVYTRSNIISVLWI